MKYSYFILIIFSYLLNACVTTQTVAGLEPVDSIVISMEQLNGNYYNKGRVQDTTEVTSFLWDSFYESHVIDGSKYLSPENSIVNVEFNDNRLNLKLIVENKVVDSISLKAKLEGNYLSIKRKYFLIPVPFFFIIYDNKTLLTMSPDGNLIMKNSNMQGVFVLIKASGSENLRTEEYIKVQQESEIIN